MNAECDLTVGVHIEKLRPRIPEHTADLLRNAVHRQVADRLFAQPFPFGIDFGRSRSLCTFAISAARFF